MPVQTRSMLKKQTLNNNTPDKINFTRQKNAPKKEKCDFISTNLLWNDPFEHLVNNCNDNSPEKENDSDSHHVSSPRLNDTYEDENGCELNVYMNHRNLNESPNQIFNCQNQYKKLVEFNIKNKIYSHSNNIVKKMLKCGHDNEKFEHYLEFCQYNIDNMTKVTIIDHEFCQYLEAIYSKCNEFNKSIKKGSYDKLRYGLVVECLRCNLNLESICRDLLSDKLKYSCV